MTPQEKAMDLFKKEKRSTREIREILMTVMHIPSARAISICKSARKALKIWEGTTRGEKNKAKKKEKERQKALAIAQYKEEQQTKKRKNKKK